jgi:hypothetical protein
LMSYNRQLYVRQNTTTSEAPPFVTDINNEDSPPSYSELYTARPQETR